MTTNQFIAAFRLQVKNLLDMNQETHLVLERLIPGKSTPCHTRRLSSTNRVVLRAEFELRFPNILPAGLRNTLENDPTPPAKMGRARITMIVNLFEPLNGFDEITDLGR